LKTKKTHPKSYWGATMVARIRSTYAYGGKKGGEDWNGNDVAKYRK
jgi:hypothetical protein